MGKRGPLILKLLSVVIIVGGFYASTLLQVDNSLELFSGDNKEEQVKFKKFRAQFAEDEELIIIGLSPQRKLESFRDFVPIRELTDQLKQLPEVKHVLFLNTIDFPSKHGQNTVTRKFLPLNDSVSFNFFYNGISAFKDITPKFLNSDHSKACVYVYLKKSDRHGEQVDRIQSVLKTFTSLNPVLIGRSVGEINLQTKIERDTSRVILFGVAILFITIILIFRDWRSIVFLFWNLLLCLALFYLFIYFSGFSLNVLNQSVALLILVLSLSDIVHILYTFQQGHKVFQVLEHSLILTSLTTALGFLVLFITGSKVIIDFAFMAVVGILLSYIVARLFSPLLFSILKVQTDKKVIQKSVKYQASASRIAIFSSLLLLIIGIGFIVSNGKIDQHLNDHLDTKSPEYASVQFYENNFGGTRKIDLFLHSDSKLITPETIHLMDSIESHFRSYYGATSVFSLNTILKRYNRYQHKGKPGAYRIPENLNQKYLESVLLRKEELGLKKSITEDLKSLRITATMHDQGANTLVAKMDSTERYIQTIAPAGTSFYLGGISAVQDRALLRISNLLLFGILSSVLLVALFMGLIYRSISEVMIVLLVNCLPIALVMTTILLLNGHFSPSSLVIVSIILGVAVDDTIHFMSRLKTNLKLNPGGNYREILYTTKNEVKKGIVSTSLLLMAGFAALLFSDFEANQQNGIFFIVGIGSALLADLYLLPRLLFVLLKTQPRSDVN